MRFTYYKERNNNTIIAVDHEDTDNKGYFMWTVDVIGYSYFGKFYLNNYCNRIPHNEARKQQPKLLKAIKEKTPLVDAKPAFPTKF